jgi:threonine dehydratase
MIVEIIEDMPDADIVVVPIGGGRLIQNNYDFNIL